MSRPDARRTTSTNLSAGRNGGAPLAGKLAIVTGGARGIGAAVVENLASKGCSVVINYTSDSSAARTNELVQRLKSDYDVSALAVQADMGSEGGPAHIVEFTKNHFQHPKTGKFQIDIIINNAGIYTESVVGKISRDDFFPVYSVNVLGPLMLMNSALPYLPNDRSGRVVNVSSISSTVGLPGQSIYGGTKGALDAMTRTWSRELAERATVNAVNPGPVATEMLQGAPDELKASMAPWMKLTPLAPVREGIDSKEVVENAKIAAGRPAYDYEIAGVVGMLCSPEAGWTTGSIICANGGWKFSY